ncbi:unannotated protein [freshwater metagenome]|uniref:Unannotated protein n=1 Tax=freshwater metagenome TaxID=449393 RepID=A0A6J6F0X8_9ZZZZ
MITTNRFYKRIYLSVNGFLIATHFGPTVLVVTIAFLLSLTQYSIFDSAKIAAAILAGQCVVGWSNDLVDFPRDLASARMRKPLVAGAVSSGALKRAIFIALSLAVVLSFIGPLGRNGGALHCLGLLSATLYNFKLKETIFSALPYIISFGAAPWAIYLSADKNPSLWLVLAFMIFASAFHFLNVVKDLESDLQQGVLGLPQRLGRQKSIAAALVLILCGVTLLALKWRVLF